MTTQAGHDLSAVYFADQGAPAVLAGHTLCLQADTDFVHLYAASRALLPNLPGDALIALIDGAVNGKA